MSILNKCIGIVSYLPNDTIGRNKRINRLNNLIADIDSKFPSISIVIIAQNWGQFNIQSKNQLHIFHYPKLGILNARKTLREKFLELGYDYIILFDDDAIIKDSSKEDIEKYFGEMDSHPNGFAFVKAPPGLGAHMNPYVKSQLNFCALSKNIFELEDFPNIDPQKGECYEDEIFSFLLHIKYSQLEFNVPEGVKSIHFKNPNIKNLGGEVPSTWAQESPRNWGLMGARAILLEKYIINNKDLPQNIKEYWKFNGMG